MRGGVFMYPRDRKDLTKAGRLRLLYEANPIGFLVEQAGGRASTGREPILDDRTREPASAHRLRVRRARGSRAHRALPRRAQRFRIRSAPVRRAQRSEESRVIAAEHAMSATHPIIAVTGSSGAGTTSVMRTFEQIFRRERVTAAFIEGDSFHRYDRATMKQKMAEALARGESPLQPFRPGRQPVRGARRAVQQLRRERTRPAPQVPA